MEGEPLRERAIVIGAGPSGLAAAGELRRAGVDAVVLDEADAIGAAWRKRYDRLRLNTMRALSHMPRARYPRGTPTHPSRDQVIAHLEHYAKANELDVRTGVRVERIDRDDGVWLLQTSAGELRAEHVIVATGYERVPSIPDWPGKDSFSGQLLHAAEYRNAEPFRERDVLVVGPGCSGMEIAYDLATGGARRVRLAVRTPPNIILRSPPGDPMAIALLKLPPRLADAPMKVIRRIAVGDLSRYGLPWPEEGIFARLRRTGMAPAIVDQEVIDAIKDGTIEVVAGVRALDEHAVVLDDGERIEADAVVAATGYRRGLEPLVGHLGVLDESGAPRIKGAEAAPGLRFIGFVSRPGAIAYMGKEARRAAREIARDAGRRRRLSIVGDAATG